MGLSLEQQEEDYQALKKAKVLEKNCAECDSPLPVHYGSCSQHPTNEAVKERAVAALHGGGQTNLVTDQASTVSPAAVKWFAGSEMKVTDEFMKAAVERYTGAVVEQVGWSARGGWKVKFA